MNRIHRLRSPRLRLPARPRTSTTTATWFHEHQAEYQGAPARAGARARRRAGRAARRRRSRHPRRPARERLDPARSRATPASRPTRRRTARISTCGSGRATGPSRECAGYLMRLDADVGHARRRCAPLLACGPGRVPPRRRRRTIAAPALDRAVRRARRAGAQFGPPQWKRVPAPYPADHPRADLLRHGGLVAATTDPMPAEAANGGVPGLVHRAMAAVAAAAGVGGGGRRAGRPARRTRPGAGRATSSPPQFGQTAAIASAQAGQKVHS